MDQKIRVGEQAQMAKTAVSYRMTEEDFLAFNNYHISHSPSLRRRQLIVRVIFPLLLALLALYYFTTQRGLFMPIYLLSVGAFVAAGSPALQRRAQRRLLKKMLQEGQNRGLFGERTVTLTPEGIEIAGDALDSRIKWSLVEKVVASDTHLFIYISAVSAYTIPKTAFASDREREHFMEMALQYRERAVGLR